MIAETPRTRTPGENGSPQPSPGRLRDTLRLLLIVGLEVGAFAGLVKLGSVSSWQVDWPNFWSWLQYASLEDALAGIMRWVALVLTGWLLASSVLYILAKLTRVPALIRGTGWLTLPVIRAAVDKALVVTVAASTVIGSRGAAAWAHPAADPRPPAVANAAPALTSQLARADAESAGRSGAVERLDYGPVAPLAMASSSGQAAPEAGGASLVELAPAAEWEVRPGHHLWAIAANRVAGASARQPDDVPAAEVAPYWRSLIDQNRSRLRSGRPGLIYAGERLSLPPVLGPRPASAPALPSPSSSPPPGPEAADPQTPDALSVPPTPTAPRVTDPSAVSSRPDRPTSRAPRDANDESPSSGTAGWMTGAGLIGATALASWALLEARRRRARRLRQSRAGEVFPPPDPTLGPITFAVKANADLPGVDRLDAALRHLAGCSVVPAPNQARHPKLRGLGRAKGRRDLVAPCPQVILRHANNDIEVFLDEPIEEAVCPWQPRAGGAIWALPDDAALPDDLSATVPCPALVQLGTCEDDAELYADLEALGALGLDGPPEAVRQIARALTATVVVSPGAQLCRVLTYGFDPYGLDEQAQSRLVASETLDALLDEAEATARPVADAVAEEKTASSFGLRAVVEEEGWEPAIAIVAGSPATPEQARRLTALGARGGQGAAVVRAGPTPRWALEAADPVGWWRLNPLGILVRPVGVAAEELRELAAFLADADAEPVPVDVPATATATGAGSAPLPPPAPPPSPGYHQRDWVVMVRLLGPVDVVNRDGVSEQGDRGQPLELLAWLATHRGVSTRTGAMDALWSGRAIDPRTLRNVISAGRLLLRNLAGEPPDGAQWIPLRQERLNLHPLVVTDIDLLRDRMAYAKRVGPDEAASVLAEGLQVLRGVPFEGQQWLWADEDYLTSSMAAEAVAVATELTTLRLQAGDIRGALAATDVGLAVIPLHDQLTELSIQAWIASGDRRTAMSIYHAYERATAARGEAVAPEIARLRNELMHAPTPE